MAGDRRWFRTPPLETSLTYDVPCRVCGEVVAHLKFWPAPDVEIYADQIERPSVVHAECAKREAAMNQDYTAGDLVEVANIINAVGSYPTVEDCARAVIPAVRRLLAEGSASVDHETLLRKYIAYVIESEGTDFILIHDNRHQTGVQFSLEEWSELERLATERQARNWGAAP